jgi:hypothetical protein
MNKIYQISNKHELINIVRNRPNNSIKVYKFYNEDQLRKNVGENQLIAVWDFDYLKHLGLKKSHDSYVLDSENMRYSHYKISEIYPSTGHLKMEDSVKLELAFAKYDNRIVIGEPFFLT